MLKILKEKDYAPLFLRLGLGIVFLLFGFHKLAAPEQTRAEIQLLLDIGLGSAAAINYYMGIIEILIALSLILGWYIKYSAPAATFLVTVIFASIVYKYGLSYDPTLFRDIGLIAAGLALWILGPGVLSLDKKSETTPLQ